MSILPQAANATLDDRKITHYLMDLTNPSGVGKPKFFMARGFTRSNWVQLKRALLEHPHRNQVSDQKTNRHGEKYKVRCSLLNPDNTNPCVVSIWIIQPSDPFPRFVTAYPSGAP
jgi:hypothetical protein